MKKIFSFSLIFLFLLGFTLYSEENELLKEFLAPFNSTITQFVNDYSTFLGLYSGNPDVKGSASIGSFPSFRFGTNFGAIFMTNPIRFLKTINLGTTSYEDLINGGALGGAKDVINFFDDNFIPIPVTTYTFEVGLPKGMSVGGNFQIIPIGDFAKGVVVPYVPSIGNLLGNITYWGVGLNFNYTIMKEYKYYPSISVGGGFNYNSATFEIKAPIGNIKIDNSNDLKSDIVFKTKGDISTFYFDFTISKNFIFFQPFLNLKFTQTIHHNITSIGLELDMSNATQEAKDNFGNGKVSVNNVTKQDAFGNNIGVIIPVTDFIVSTGFEFVMGVYRMGLSGSYGLVSQKGMVNLSIRFQAEKERFKKK